MPATSFNPLEVARDLKAAGIDAGQAEAIADAMRKAAVATRADIATLRSEIRWMVGFLAALNLAMATKLFGLV